MALSQGTARATDRALHGHRGRDRPQGHGGLLQRRRLEASSATSPRRYSGISSGRLYPDLEEAKRVMNALRSAGHGGRGICETFRTSFLAKSGERIPVAISGTLLYDDDGEEDGTIGFAKDLREILSKDQLATCGEVAIGLSHEIRNPLAVIQNQAELLERDVERLAGEGDCSVETERLDAIRREVARICGGRRAARRDGGGRSLRDRRVRRSGAHGRPARRAQSPPAARSAPRGRAHPRRRRRRRHPRIARRDPRRRRAVASKPPPTASRRSPRSSAAASTSCSPTS